MLRQVGLRGLARCVRQLLAMISLNNPSKGREDETLLDEAIRADKLHDGHLELIVRKIQRAIPNFWTGFPREGDLTMVKKKAFISEFITCELKHGNRRYGKTFSRLLRC